MAWAMPAPIGVAPPLTRGKCLPMMFPIASFTLLAVIGLIVNKSAALGDGAGNWGRLPLGGFTGLSGNPVMSGYTPTAKLPLPAAKFLRWVSAAAAPHTSFPQRVDFGSTPMKLVWPSGS